MTEIRYYHLTRSSLEDALPQLLLKSLERGWRAVVIAGSKERVESLNRHLWTWSDREFLPHGAAEDGEAPHQPVWLTHLDENPNGANVLFLTDGAESSNPDGYQLVCRLFDGNDETALGRARACWKAEKAAAYRLTYWRQTADGWVREAEANAPETKTGTTI